MRWVTHSYSVRGRFLSITSRRPVVGTGAPGGFTGDSVGKNDEGFEVDGCSIAEGATPVLGTGMGTEDWGDATEVPP